MFGIICRAHCYFDNEIDFECFEGIENEMKTTSLVWPAC